jgi:hypothetical protein
MPRQSDGLKRSSAGCVRETNGFLVLPETSVPEALPVSGYWDILSIT